MPAVCPDCNANVPEAEPARHAACAECGKKFMTGAAPIASGPAPIPRRKRDWGDEDEPAIRKNSSGNTFLLVGGVLLALLLVCGGVAAVGGVFYVARVNAVQRDLAVQQAHKNQQQMQKMNPRVPPPLDAGALKAPVILLNVGPGNAVVTHEGVLLLGDPQFTGKPFKAFAVNLEPGRKYQIELASQQMDSFLRLYGPNGEPLQENDDFKGLDSGIIFTPDRAGQYKIHATVLGALNNNAPFTLTVRAE